MNGSQRSDLLFLTTQGALKLAQRVHSYLSQKELESYSFKPRGVMIDSFSDGSPKVRLSPNLNYRGRDVYFLTHSYELEGTSNSNNFANTLFVLDSLKQAGVGNITLINPLLFFQREDRSQGRRNALGLNVLYNSISPYISHLIGVDVHNEQATNIFQGRYTDLKASFSLIPKLEDLIKNDKENWIILSPDQGGVQRALYYSQKLKIPYGHANKLRDHSTGETSIVSISGYDGQKKILTIDDISDTGGTLNTLYDSILSDGYEPERFVSVLSHLTGTNKSKIELLRQKDCEIITTDSCLTKGLEKMSRKYQIEIVSIAPSIAEAIYGINTNTPLRKLYTQ